MDELDRIIDLIRTIA
ncbi:hypothetical protein RO1_29560 [Roseburia intestinalis XB6B4]|nr:hypothetical protein RO1_29560 [Roseburia intestinalis XB6B4]